MTETDLSKQEVLDNLKEIISKHMDTAFTDFNPEYFEHGEMRTVGLVADRAIEDIVNYFKHL